MKRLTIVLLLALLCATNAIANEIDTQDKIPALGITEVSGNGAQTQNFNECQTRRESTLPRLEKLVNGLLWIFFWTETKTIEIPIGERGDDPDKYCPPYNREKNTQDGP